MIAVIDNYDSFVFNIARYLRKLGAEPKVFRNDALGVSELAAMRPEAILISPGPGTPEDAGAMKSESAALKRPSRFSSCWRSVCSVAIFLRRISSA